MNSAALVEHEPVETWLRRRIGALLRRPPEEIDPERRFVEFGIDSVEATSIGVELEQALGRTLPPTLLWDHPTIAALARHLDNPTADTGGPVPDEHCDLERLPALRDLDARLDAMRRADAPVSYFREYEGRLGARARVAGRTVLSFNAFNYLGLGGHPEVNEAAMEAIRTYGTSTSSSRIVGGLRTVHRELEEELARFVGLEDVVTFPSGFGTNVSTIAALMGPRDLVVHDQFAHASMLDGLRLSGAHGIPFPHNDVEALDAILERERGRFERALVLVEGLYSADGDLGPLAQLVEVKRRHRAWLYVDEAHSLGTLGARGRGAVAHAGLAAGDVDVWMATLSKALGSIGGVVGGSRALTRCLRYTSPGVVASVSLSPPSAAAALASLRVLEREPERVERLTQLSRHFDRAARALGLDLGASDPASPTKPVLVGEEHRCMRISNALFERGLDVQPMIHPSVSAGRARLRFFVTVEHTTEEIDRALAWTAEALR